MGWKIDTSHRPDKAPVNDRATAAISFKSFEYAT